VKNDIAVKKNTEPLACNYMPKVAILLCTYNGQEYLAEQLDSFKEQTFSNWELWVSDDGSSDCTDAIVSSFKNKLPEKNISFQLGPRKGFASNFISLICNLNIKADFYAYSDQDDVWEKDKLAIAVRWLESIPEDIPALYCSRTRLVDSNNNEIGLSPLFTKPPSFANALVQNIGGGNTMVFNCAARKLLVNSGDVKVTLHDWWTYIIVSGCGGLVFYDETPYVRYRQHNGNLIGMNSSWMARFKRIKILWAGHFKICNDIHINELQRVSHKLTNDNKLILNLFKKSREINLIQSFFYLKQSGVYKQTLLGNISLVVAILFRKI
jgi:glycosyltransferase involved in cell wall biosynthesis